MSADENVIPLKAAYESRITREDPVDDKGKVVKDPLAYVQAELGLPSLRRVIRRGRTDSVFDLELDDGQLVPIGGSAQLLDPRKVDVAIADATGVAVHYYGPKAFRPIAGCLLHLAELEESGTDQASITAAWIAGYTYEREGRTLDLATTQGRDQAVGNTEPFRDTDGRLHVVLNDLENYVRRVCGVPTTHRDIAARLGRLGFTPTQVESTPADGKRRRRRYHASPPGFDPRDQA